MIKSILVAVIFAGLYGCSSVAPATKDIAASIQAGLSAEDHLRVATYFEEKAFAYDREAADHERLARSYINRHGATALAPLSHLLRDRLHDAAKVARALSAEHRRAAASPAH